jgi:hypothetical protein
MRASPCKCSLKEDPTCALSPNKNPARQSPKRGFNFMLWVPHPFHPAAAEWNGWDLMSYFRP